jgi:hypothetical protein
MVASLESLTFLFCLLALCYLSSSRRYSFCISISSSLTSPSESSTCDAISISSLTSGRENLNSDLSGLPTKSVSSSENYS